MNRLTLDPRLAAELSGVVHRFAALHPYERAWEIEAWGLAQTDPWLRAAFSEVWTPTRIAKASTVDLEALLRDAGVRDIDAPFAAMTGTGAWAVADQWKAQLGRPTTSHEDLFLGLTAAAFWNRLRADTPSDEMVYDRLVDGETLAAEKKWGAACDCWGLFWDSLRERTPKNVRRPANATGLFRATVLEVWVQRYCAALLLATKESPDYVTTGLAFVDEFLACFPLTGGAAGWMLHATKGRFLIQCGRHQEGFVRFEGLLREAPTAPAGYRMLVDAVLSTTTPPAPLVTKSLAALRKAVQMHLDRDARWGLAERLAELEALAPKPATP
jgi:hypothetical protein